LAEVKSDQTLREINPVSDELNWKITNFIKESINFKATAFL